MLKRPVKGKKNPSATTLARAFGMGLTRFFSTSMRDENVRILSTLGPEKASAALRAMGRRMDCSSCLEAAAIGAMSGEA